MKSINRGKAVAIVDYGMGNINSVFKMISLLNFEPYLTNSLEGLKKADYIILPGVGSYASAMKSLNSLGLVKALTEQVIDKEKPFLGICLGMQMMSDHGEEGGVSSGLGWIKGATRKIQKRDGYCIPHMGWSRVKIQIRTNLFKDMTGDSGIFYFAHSYVLEPEDQSISIATIDHGCEYVAAIKKGNIFGTQFHPEKSQEYGKVCIENFFREV